MSRFNCTYPMCNKVFKTKNGRKIHIGLIHKKNKKTALPKTPLQHTTEFKPLQQAQTPLTNYATSQEEPLWPYVIIVCGHCGNETDVMFVGDHADVKTTRPIHKMQRSCF